MAVLDFNKPLPLDSNSGGSFGGVNDLMQQAPGSSVQQYGNKPSFDFNDSDFQTGSFAQKLQAAPEEETGVWNSFKNFGSGLWEMAKGGANWLERQVQNESDERGIANWDEYQKYSKELDNNFTTESRRQELIKKMKEDKILTNDYEDKQRQLRTEAEMQSSVLGKRFEYTSEMENSIAKYFLDAAAPELQNLKGQVNEANQVVEHASTLANEIMESAQAIEGLSISREEKDKMIQEYINTRILTSKDFLKDYAKNIRVYAPDEAYERTMDNKNYKAIGQQIEELDWDMQTAEAGRFFREPGIVSAYTSLMNVLGLGTEFVGDVADFVLPTFRSGDVRFGLRGEEQGFSELYSNQATGNFSSFFRELNEGADNIAEFGVGLLGGSVLLKIPRYLAKTNAVVKTVQGMEAIAGSKFTRGFTAFAGEMTEDMLKYDMAFQSFMDRPMSEKDFKENLMYNVGFNSLIGIGSGALFSKERELMMGLKNRINSGNLISPETYREIEEVSKNGIQDTRHLDFYILNDAARIERGDTQGMIEVAAMDKVYANDLNKYKAQTTTLLEKGETNTMTGLDRMVYRYATGAPSISGITPSELRQTMQVMDTLVSDSKNSGYLQAKVNLANMKSWANAAPETRMGIIENAMTDRANILMPTSSEATSLANFTKYMVQGDLLRAMDTLAKVPDEVRPGLITAANKIFKDLPDTLMSSPEFLKSIEVGDNVFGYIYKGMVDGTPTFTDLFHGMDITPKEIRQGARSAIWSNTVAGANNISTKTFSPEVAKKLENAGFRIVANKLHPEDTDLFIEKMTSLNFNDMRPQDGALLKTLFDEETKTFVAAMTDKMNQTFGVEVDVLEKFFKSNLNTHKLFEYTPTKKVRIRAAQATSMVQDAMNRIAFGEIDEAMNILRRVMVVNDVDTLVQGVRNGNYTRLKEYIADNTLSKFLNLTSAEMDTVLGGLNSLVGVLDPAHSKHIQEYVGVFTSIFNEVNTITRVKDAPLAGHWMKNIFVNLLEKLGKSGQYTQESLASHISKC